jgi:hypothetical protein
VGHRHGFWFRATRRSAHAPVRRTWVAALGLVLLTTATLAASAPATAPAHSRFRVDDVACARLRGLADNEERGTLLAPIPQLILRAILWHHAEPDGDDHGIEHRLPPGNSATFTRVEGAVSDAALTAAAFAGTLKHTRAAPLPAVRPHLAPRSKKAASRAPPEAP